MANTRLARCYECRKNRECHTYSARGGATYRRSGRSYTRHICRECCVEIADFTRLFRYGRGSVYGEHLNGIKAACEAFGVPVDDLPDYNGDKRDTFDRPTHPLNWAHANYLLTDEHRRICAEKGWT